MKDTRLKLPLVSAPPTDSTQDGGNSMNVCGFLRDESGWGTAVRSYIGALRSLGLPLALNDLSFRSSNRSGDRTLTGFQTAHPHPTNLICVDPTQHFAVLGEVGAEYFQGRYNIGAWAWELPRFPVNWVDRFAFYDEIWVMSSFVANALAPLAPIPIIRIPPVLAIRGEGSRERGRLRLGVGGEDFVFLFVFDFHSHFARKNPLALIDAFSLAFRSGEPVRLVIKCVNGESDPEGLSAIHERARGQAIDIWDDYWTSQQMLDLYSACDSYVSLHRSEGVGLTIAEAMAVGKPVIATGWSGNMDFMDVSNSYPVRYRLLELEKSVGPYRSGEVWAEPSVEHGAELMGHVYEHREEATARGAAARQEIERNYSENEIASLIQLRLEAIAIRRDLAAYRERTWSAFFDYQQIASRIRQVVSRTVPPEATVIVVSKGDDELLKLGGPEGWHFPRTCSGTYAGHHPADSQAAITHLEDLRAAGGGYLLIPKVAFWWLDYYVDFRKHLDARYSRVWSDDTCAIYRLAVAT